MEKEKYLKYLENKSFGWYLIKASRKAIHMYNKELQKINISVSQSGVLNMLYEAELANDTINQTDLSKALFLYAVNTHKLIKHLKLKKLVTTKEYPTDRRCIIVTLTQTGRDLVPHIKKADMMIAEQLKRHYITSKSSELEKNFNVSLTVLKKLTELLT